MQVRDPERERTKWYRRAARGVEKELEAIEEGGCFTDTGSGRDERRWESGGHGIGKEARPRRVVFVISQRG